MGARLCKKFNIWPSSEFVQVIIATWLLFLQLELVLDAFRGQLDCIHSSPSDESKEVIAGTCMMQCPNLNLLMNVQHQRGSSDCGVLHWPQ